MGRLTYVCATCEEHFTRRYSATRHNLTIHNNRGEIVSLLEYLVGRSSRRYHASHPFWYRRRRGKGSHRFGHASTVADSVGTPGMQQQRQYQPQQQSLEEQERYRWQQQQAVSQAIPPAAPPYPTDQMFQSQSMDDEKKTTTLSHETRLKIEELKRLVYKYPQYHRYPSAVISCVIYFCNDGDNTLLDEKLEHLRMLDSAIG
jgi:hypothetical protein